MEVKAAESVGGGKIVGSDEDREEADESQCHQKNKGCDCYCPFHQSPTEVVTGFKKNWGKDVQYKSDKKTPPISLEKREEDGNNDDHDKADWH